MPRVPHLALFLLAAAALPACSGTDSLYCDPSTPCAAGLPFCDTGGGFAASEGIANTCIPEPPPVTVTVVGTGRVSSGATSPEAIDCGATCTARFEPDSSVTLTATPDDGTEFLGWAGDCDGKDPVCTLTADRAHTVTASFGTPTRLRIALPGDGAGVVTSNDEIVDCSESECVYEVAVGSILQLTAATSGVDGFDGWSGACAGQEPTCAIQISGNDTEVGARFRAPWTRTSSSDGVDGDVALDVAVAADGSIVVVGKEQLAVGIRGWLRKYDADGNVAWTEYCARDNCELVSVAIAGNGEIVVGGIVHDPQSLNADWYVARHAAGGTRLWSTPAGDPNLIEILLDVAVTSTGDAIAVGGVSPGDGYGSSTMQVRSYAPDSVLRWSHDYEVGEGLAVAIDSQSVIHAVGELGSQYDRGIDQQITTAGVLAATTEYPEGPVFDIAFDGARRILLVGGEVRATDGDGDVLWRWAFGPNESFRAIAVDPGSNVFVIGTSSLPGGQGLVMKKLSPTGKLLWSRPIQAAAGEVYQGYGVACDADSNVVFAGGAPSNGGDIWLRKYYQ